MMRPDAALCLLSVQAQACATGSNSSPITWVAVTTQFTVNHETVPSSFNRQWLSLVLL